VKQFDTRMSTMQALNEISITRGNSGGMCSYEIYVNKVFLTVVQGDGILIATPTGSTAYNLSCGGSIVHNAAQVICLTPINPHSLSFRPIILPVENCVLEIKMKKHSRQSTALVAIDGQESFNLQQSETLVINESPFKVPFIHWKHDNADQRWANKLNN
jgi:NAD+ kinase